MRWIGARTEGRDRFKRAIERGMGRQRRGGWEVIKQAEGSRS